ncbi:MAG: FAD-dependent oxidoreductase [Acidobacteriota bacterium]
MAQSRSGRSGTAGGVSSRVSRRDLLRGVSAASLLAASGSGRAVARVLSPVRSGPRVVVVGAGVFGAFSALSLLRGGARVTLLDAWGPGNSRASSGGGIPGNEGRGFKVADDTRGAPFDPTGGDRVASADGLRAAREFLGRRFPALKDAPLTESRVCQYENTTDHRFLLDRHPGAGNAWIAGGGSGHGFKMGPAVGERVANLVLGRAKVDPFFGLGRLTKASAAGSSAGESVS